MLALTDLAGQRFGKLVVVSRADRGSKWECRCDCGRTMFVRSDHLKSGATKTCGEVGCARRGRTGLSNHPDYLLWKSIRSRCFNKNATGYKHYGGRGVTLCDRWRSSFRAFVEDMGQRPSPEHSVDRINNDGNYEPSNCRWATPREQAANRRAPAERSASC